MTTVRVVLPAHLKTLAHVQTEVRLELCGTPTRTALLDALEAAYPALAGTLRDPATGRRRPFIRFFACQQDLSYDDGDVPLPAEVVRGDEPYLVVGAMAGG